MCLGRRHGPPVTKHMAQSSRTASPNSTTSLPGTIKFPTYAHGHNKPTIKLQDADILQLVQSKLNEMLNNGFACIIS